MRRLLLVLLFLLAPAQAQLGGPQGEIWVRPNEVRTLSVTGKPGVPVRLFTPGGSLRLAEGPPGTFSAVLSHWRNGAYRLEQGQSKRPLGPVRVLSGRLPVARVTKPDAIFRTGPDDVFDRVDPLLQGVTLTVDGRQNGWLRAGSYWVAESDVQLGDFPAPHPVLSSVSIREDEAGRATVRMRLGEPVAVQVESRPEHGELWLHLPGASLATGETAYASVPRRIQAVQLVTAPGETMVRMTLGPEGNWGYGLRWEAPHLVLELSPPPHRGWSNPPRPGGQGTGRPLVGLVIVLDPGHGGSDLGAVGVGGLQEKDLNLALALALRDELQREGARVVLTRDRDAEVAGSPDATAEQELGARVRIAEEAGANLFLSLHHNAKADIDEARRAHGTHIYYYRPHSRSLALAVAEPLAAAIGESEHMALWRSFNVTRQTRMPAILVESNFISNPEIEARMRQPDYLPQAARGLRAGIEAFLRASAGP